MARKLLFARRMDHVFFAFKRAHHAALNFARPILREFGLTPARFDIIVAATIDPTQSGVRRLLGLARATISEMLGRLEELGLITREKLGRTRRIALTAKGRALFERAHRECVESKKVARSIDELLTVTPSEANACRATLAALTTLARRAFRDKAHDLYPPPEFGDVLYFAA